VNVSKDSRSDPQLAEECAEIRKLFDLPVVAMRCIAKVPIEEVYASELVTIANAGRKRRDEFLAGRACAHACLEALGVDKQPIVAGEIGMPVWPEGILGSISHSEAYCAAVALRTGSARGIGLDIERDRAVTQTMEPVIFGDTETAQLSRLAPDERRRIATIAFSAKEAFYKAQFPRSRAFLEYRDARVEVGEGRFDIFLLRDIDRIGSCGDRLHGRYALADGYVLAGTII
jgi:4'-phosphopantetheinyl transferase EntD